MTDTGYDPNQHAKLLRASKDAAARAQMSLHLLDEATDIEAVRFCEGCEEEIPEENVYEYGADRAHTVWPEDPYFSSPSAGLP